MQEYIQVLIPIFGLTINVSAQILCFRSISNLGLLKSLVSGFLVGSLGILFLQIWFESRSIEASAFSSNFWCFLATNLFIYGALSYCYFNFCNLGETARRIRIIRELYDSEEGLTLTEILNRYNSKLIVTVRLTRLLSNGQIYLNKGRYFVGKPTFLWMARAVLFLKLLVLGKPSEFS